MLFSLTSPTRRRVVQLAALAFAAAGASCAQAQEIRNHASAVCMDTTGKGSGHGVAAWPCNGKGNQKFVLRDFGIDQERSHRLPEYQIVYGDLCLERVPRLVGTVYRLEACKLYPNGRPMVWQSWWFDTNFPGNVNPMAGLLRPISETTDCVELSGNFGDWSLDILLQRPLPLNVGSCTGGLNQRWWVNMVK